MNFTRIRRLIQYIILLYVLALTDLWITLSRIWRRDPQLILDGPLETLRPFGSLKFAKPVLVAVAKSPSRIRRMIFPQGVPIFPDNSEEQSSENTHVEEYDRDDIDSLYADVVGPMTSDWAAGPRDETALPRILVAMKSINKNEADYALNEMIKIIEKIDMDAHSNLVAKAFDTFIQLFTEKAQTDQRCSNILNHLPFLYSCTTSSDEYSQYGDIMLDYLLQCLKGQDQFRRTAIYATNALLERDTIGDADIKEKIIPTLFSLLLSKTVIEEHRNELATALCRIAQSRLDTDWIFYHFIPKYSLLLRDEHTHVKKAAIATLGFLAKEFGEKFTEEFIVPHVVGLIGDSNWTIRKIICEIIVEVSQNCPTAIRAKVLAPRFIHLLRDTSRWVSYQALQELGPFISTFADSRITGLNINEKGHVVDDKMQHCDVEHSPYPYDKLPDGVYLPRESGRYLPFSQEDADNVLGEMTSMLDNWDSGELRGGPSSEADFVHPPSVAAKCSSVENLTSLIYNDEDIDDHDQSFFHEDDEEDEIMEEAEKANSDECQVTYWNASADIVDISDDLIAFGSSSDSGTTSGSELSTSLKKLAITHNTDSTTTAQSSRSDTVATFKSGRFSETDSFRSEPDDMDYDPLSDCRGLDDDEEKMDATEAEVSVSGTTSHNHVPKELVDNFLSMVTPSSMAQDPDINRFCAHNFPAVAYTLGRENWFLLKDTYKRLSNEDLRVRMSIASSLHEIGRIIGTVRTDIDLLPIFIQDDTPEVRYNILKNLFEFFKCLSGEKRAEMIDVLPEIMPVSTNNFRNDWRYRHEFVKQCRNLCSLYGNEEINRTISAIALTMANDRIAEVRTEAVLLIVEIIRRLVIAESLQKSGEKSNDNMPLTENLLKDVVTSFAKTQKWSRRLTFTHICQGLLEQKALSQQQFRYYLLSQLLAMTSDKVANVRLGSCRVLALLDHDLCPIPLAEETTATVIEMLKKLSNDSDIDVSREARLSLKEISEDKTDVALRGRRIKVREEGFFKDGDISSYDPKDMSIESQANNTTVFCQDNYNVVDMDISSETDGNKDEPDTSEC